MRATVTSLVALAATVRDLMSLDIWRIIRQMNEDFRPTPGRDGFLDLLDKLDVLLMHLAAFAGEIAESMTRTHAWRFLDLGRRLERGTARVAARPRHARAGGGSEPEALEALLEIPDSVMTYRSRYASRFQLGAVLDLLICDETNPRSIAYQLGRVRRARRAAADGRTGASRAGRPGAGGGAAADDSQCRHRPASRDEFEAGTRGPLNKLLGNIDATLPAALRRHLPPLLFPLRPDAAAGRIRFQVACVTESPNGVKNCAIRTR